MGFALIIIVISGKLFRWLFLSVDVSASLDMANYWAGQQFICGNDGFNAYYYGRPSELLLPFVMKGLCFVGFKDIQTYGYFWALINWLFYSISVAYLLATMSRKWMWRKTFFFAALSFFIVIYPVGNGIQLLRQSLSISFAVLFFATYLRYGRSIPSYLFMATACLTHVQAIISVLQFWTLKINLKYYSFFIVLALIIFIAITNILVGQLSYYPPIFEKDATVMNKLSPSILGAFTLMIASILSKSRYVMSLGVLSAGFALFASNNFQRLLYGFDFLFFPLILIIFLARVKNLYLYMMIAALLIGYAELISVLSA